MARALRQDVEKWSLDKWQQMFDSIYGKRNAVLSTERAWYRMLEEIGELVLPVKQQTIQEIQWQLPDVFAWLCTLVVKSGSAKLSDTLWKKFQLGCPGCKREQDCACADIPEALDKSNLQPVTPSAQLPFGQPVTLDEWQAFFKRLYGKRNAQQDPMWLLGRMIHDIGQTSRLLRLRAPQEQIDSKLASVFAWLVGICNRYSASFPGERGELRLSEITWEKYPDYCAKCHSRPCGCHSPITRVFISFPAELKEAKDLLGQKIEEELKLRVYSFPNFSVYVPKGIMNEAFFQIAHSDAVVVLLGASFSAPVYAELLQALYHLDANRVFVAIQEVDKRDEQLESLIQELRYTHIYDWFKAKEELVQKVLPRLHDEIERYTEMSKGF